MNILTTIYAILTIVIVVFGLLDLIFYAIDIVSGIKEIIKEKRQAKLSGKNKKPQRG